MVRYGKNLSEKIGRVPGAVHLSAIARTYFRHHLILLSSVDKKRRFAIIRLLRLLFFCCITAAERNI